jgi:hypothetical protein
MLFCLLFIILHIHLEDQLTSTEYLFRSIQNRLLTIAFVLSCARKIGQILLILCYDDLYRWDASILSDTLISVKHTIKRK